MKINYINNLFFVNKNHKILNIKDLVNPDTIPITIVKVPENRFLVYSSDSKTFFYDLDFQIPVNVSNLKEVIPTIEGLIKSALNLVDDRTSSKT